MLKSLDSDQQDAAIASFIQNELVVKREEVTLLHQQDSQQAEQLRELDAQQTELSRQQQLNVDVARMTHMRRPEILKVNIFKYR